MTNDPCSALHIKSPVFLLLRSVAGICSALFLAFFVGVFAASAMLVTKGPLAEDTTVIVPRGSSAKDIGDMLAEKGAVYHPFLFRVAARFSGPLRAGEYALPARASVIDIANLFHKGKTIIRAITFAEGVTSADIVRLLQAEPALSGEIAQIPEEGTLLPETYHFTFADTRESIISRMQKAMDDTIEPLWRTRDEGLPLSSMREAVILASIVEKETARGDERARIAGVFYNRLQKRMRLQSDPTVIYAITQGRTSLDRSLRREDLSFASPINTYASDGLPPQPICNPGRASLQAVMKPERHNFFYFVADGTGGHAFATDLDSHNKNVRAWIRFMRSNQAP